MVIRMNGSTEDDMAEKRKATLSYASGSKAETRVRLMAKNYSADAEAQHGEKGVVSIVV